MDALLSLVPPLAEFGSVLSIPGWPWQWAESTPPEEKELVPTTFVEEWVEAGRARGPQVSKVRRPAER
jgi:hypothetical protein